MLHKYQALLASAQQQIYKVANKTALDYAPQLSSQQHNHVWIKREDQQPVFSYKLRGAFNLMANLTAEQKQHGVIAASAGNHAQGVALAGEKLQIHTTVVMPKTTPEIKISAVRRLGAEVVLYGNNYDDAKEHALTIAADTGLSFVPPYDHPLIIAGQATVALEILEQHPGQPDIIFVPVGGGGLLAGTIVAIKARHPEIRIIGVESAESPSMYQALKQNRRVILEHVGIFAEGVAVRQVGEENFKIAKQWVEEILLVSNDEICAAVKDIFEDTRAIPETSGAIAVAGLKQFIAREAVRDMQMVGIFSGANLNFDRLRHIAELAALGEHREAIFGIMIPEQAGSFKRLCQDLGARHITEFNYRYADNNTAHVFVGLQLRHGKSEKETLFALLQEKNYTVADLSEDEIAKMHIRYMVGGHTDKLADELLYRFEFPERPGSLLHFLSSMGNRWNISLFHYRNHGASYGRVLMGIQVPKNERAAFDDFLTALDINYWEETNNTAYQMFLA